LPAVLALALAWPALAQSQVAGRVYERQGPGLTPILGARVSIYSAAGNQLASTETDEFGGFIFENLAAGEISVEARHERYYPVGKENGGRQRVVCPASALCGPIDFEMRLAGDVEIEVMDSLDFPIEDVAVRVTAADPVSESSRAAFAVRAHRGLFRLAAVSPGRYHAVVEPGRRGGQEFHGRSVEFEVAPGQVLARLRIVLPSTRTYRVAGRVLGLERSGDWQVFVVLEPENLFAEISEPPHLGAPLDREGRFVLNAVPRGFYQAKLVWLQDGQLDPASGPQQPLGRMEARENRSGLYLAVPHDQEADR
jgi:hypothetical protein